MDLVPDIAFGNLAESSLAEVVAAAFRASASGTIAIEQGRGETRVFLRYGVPVGTAPYETQQSFIDHALEIGAIKAATIDRYTKVAGRLQMDLVDVLVSEAVVTPDRMSELLSEYHQRQLEIACCLRAGKYELRGWEPPPAWCDRVHIDAVRTVASALMRPEMSERLGAVRDAIGHQGLRLSDDFADSVSRLLLNEQDHGAFLTQLWPLYPADAAGVLPGADAMVVSAALFGLLDESAEEPVHRDPPAADAEPDSLFDSPDVHVDATPEARPPKDYPSLHDAIAEGIAEATADVTPGPRTLLFSDRKEPELLGGSADLGVTDSKQVSLPGGRKEIEFAAPEAADESLELDIPVDPQPRQPVPRMAQVPLGPTTVPPPRAPPLARPRTAIKPRTTTTARPLLSKPLSALRSAISRSGSSQERSTPPARPKARKLPPVDDYNPFAVHLRGLEAQKSTPPAPRGESSSPFGLAEQIKAEPVKRTRTPAMGSPSSKPRMVEPPPEIDIRLDSALESLSFESETPAESPDVDLGGLSLETEVAPPPEIPDDDLGGLSLETEAAPPEDLATALSEAAVSPAEEPSAPLDFLEGEVPAGHGDALAIEAARDAAMETVEDETIGPPSLAPEYSAPDLTPSPIDNPFEKRLDISRPEPIKDVSRPEPISPPSIPPPPPPKIVEKSAESLEAGNEVRRRLLQRALKNMGRPFGTVTGPHTGPQRTFGVEIVESIPAREAAPAPVARPQPTAKDDLAAELKRRVAEAATADHFAVLGISREASSDDVKQAFLDLAKKFHPDRLSSEGLTSLLDDAQAAFGRIKDAYEAIADADNRDRYRTQIAGPKKGSSAAAEDAKVLYKRAISAAQRKDFKSAEADLRQALESNPPSQYVAELAYVLMTNPAQRDVAKAEIDTLIKRALQSPDANDRVFVIAAYAARMAGEEDKIEKFFRRALEKNPKNIEAAREIRLMEMRRNSSDKKKR